MRRRRPRSTPPRAAIDEVRAELSSLAWELHDIGAAVRLLVDGASPATRRRIRAHLDQIDTPEEQP